MQKHTYISPTFHLLLTAIMVVGSMTCISMSVSNVLAQEANGPNAVELARHDTEFSYVYVEPVRVGTQYGIAVMFKGTDDLHYYANPETATAPGFELKVQAESDNFNFGEAFFPKWVNWADPTGAKIDVYVGDFTVFVPITSVTEQGAAERNSVEILITGQACTSKIILMPFEKTIQVKVDWNERESWREITVETDADEVAVDPRTAAATSQSARLAKVDRLMRLFADSAPFPDPSVGATLRITAPALVNKVESLHFAALDYQFLAVRALRMAKQHFKNGDDTRAEKLVENGKRYYRIATALRRDSQSILDGTYSANQTALEGVKEACHTASSLGLHVMNPVLGKAVDYLYLSADYAIDRTVLGKAEADRNAIKRLLVKLLFDETKFSKLGNRTISEYMKNRVGKELFPIIDNLLQSKEAKFAVSRLVKQTSVMLSEEAILSQMLDSGLTEKQQKTFNNFAEEDKKRFLTKPQGLDTTQQQSTTKVLYFKVLSTKDKMEAEKVLNAARSSRSLASRQMVGFNLMMQNCRQIIRKWSDSRYAYIAKQMIIDMPERYRPRYNVTKEELDLSRFAIHRPGTKPFKFELIWVQCNNKSCKNVYKMIKRGYWLPLESNPNTNPMASGSMPITCNECGKQMFAVELIWVKCNNKSCNKDYQMSKGEYFLALASNPNMNPMAARPTAITCKKCGEQSLFAAKKCPYCETVFIEGTGVKEPGDYHDRCPECGRSKVEERWKTRKR